MDIQQFSCQTPETLAIREEYPSLAGLEAGDIPPSANLGESTGCM